MRGTWHEMRLEWTEGIKQSPTGHTHRIVGKAQVNTGGLIQGNESINLHFKKSPWPEREKHIV